MTRPPTPAGDQHGIATIEFVAVAWVFMVVVLGAAQFGLWWHAQHVVLAAAQGRRPPRRRRRRHSRRRPRPRP
jgi:TadE-like protein